MADDAPSRLRPLVYDLTWQMHYGERAALVGLLSVLRPELSIEIGTAGGGSLTHLAARSTRVHSFDISPDVLALEERFPNVTFHVGDSAETLPPLLDELERDGRNVDFVLVDGDHTRSGVRRDAEILLASAACAATAVVFHDTSNADVRAGLDDVGFEQHPKVAFVALDFVPGYVSREEARRFEVWNGLGLVILDAQSSGAVVDATRFESSRMLDLARAQLLANGDAA
ncbi:MAG TPA: class I SAM-dependent methyltransferase [Gaiellaceae bacterium]|nr:class I SAM-dependent methyltransferase [Gaiellaceae bacterium]